MRQIKVVVQFSKPEIPLVIKDSEGKLWDAQQSTFQNPVSGNGDGITLVLTEIADWTIYVEGREIGTASHPDAGEAVRLAFRAAGLTSMPEGVEVKAQGQHDAFVVFTLDGRAFCVTHKEFVDEVMKSSRWTLARQAKRAEIDALGIELGKLPRK